MMCLTILYMREVQEEQVIVEEGTTVQKRLDIDLYFLKDK